MTHASTGCARPLLLWRFDEARTVASTASAGGGLGRRRWVLNAQVPLDYARADVEDHVAEIAAAAGCAGAGVGLLTAASFDDVREVEDQGVSCTATVGVSKPTWAADADDAVSPTNAGTINIVVQLPVLLEDAALLNAIATATEAKSQALLERGVPGTGTASDAVCIVCPATGPAERFGGPRSPWGARVGRAVHAAVLRGLRS